jgi:acetoin:2,6-dichlorophenolindophenol oxidoreductase subunit alpha
MGIAPRVMLQLFETMMTSRRYEEAIEKIYFEGKLPSFNMANGPIPGEMHLSNGQEPCAAGVCAHLREDDAVTAPHRSHHIAIAKGVDLKAMSAEIFGKRSGLSGGRGGHMHLFDTRVNFSSGGIIAEGMAPAVGAAHARKMQGKDSIAVAFIGEGAANQGVFHEALNLAAVWRAPVVFVIEDNGWGVSVAREACTSVPHNAERARAYGMPGVRVPGNDPVAIYEAAGEAVARARGGGGPTLLDLETARLAGHFVGDRQDYRPEGQLAELQGRDPIPLFRGVLSGHVSAPEIEQCEARAAARVAEAIQHAREAAYPAAEEAFERVFA